jgi:predicted transposase YbfD/YdcC
VRQALGFSRDSMPCAATFSLLFRRLDRQALECSLGRWVAQVLAQLPTSTAGLAIDGKTLRGSRQQGAALTHLLSAVSHHLGLTLGQVAVPAKTNETTAIHTLLRQLPLAGQVVTMDALLTQQAIARAVTAAGADYVMVVKDNQPSLREAIATAFADPALLAQHAVSRARSRDRGHGRLERRTLTLSTALVGFLGWPGHRQVFEIVRRRTALKTGAVQTETVYGITSLPPSRADARRILAYVRHHWAIENRSHYVRDVTFGEDHSQVRVGNTPQVMAALRNAAIALHRLAGETNIAAACRRTAAQPRRALALLGIRSRKH